MDGRQGMARGRDGSDGTGNGILPDRVIRRYVEDGFVTVAGPLDADQVQPSSLDLRLGPLAHRVRASFLPGRGRSVAERLDELRFDTLDLSRGAVLETGCVYVVEIAEGLALPAHVSATANPKSSTGRIDVFTRLITDGGTGFDAVAAGYRGKLYAEISPRTFPVIVREGSRLSQIRFRVGDARLGDAEMYGLDRAEAICQPGPAKLDGGLVLSIDLEGRDGGPLGYRARRHAGVIDVDRKAALDLDDYWEPIHPKRGGLVLDPEEFYILVSRESVRVPPDMAAEMVAVDPVLGEFRAHYAGFFDPGFGDAAAGGEGSRAVLEVRSRDVPFVVEHGQDIGRLVYERMAARPDALYGTGLGSNYQRQGLKLSKHFG